jgi:hypothetical protein
MMPTSAPAVVAGIRRLAPRDGGDLRTRSGNNRTGLTGFFAVDDLLSCSKRHRFKTLT